MSMLAGGSIWEMTQQVAMRWEFGLVLAAMAAYAWAMRRRAEIERTERRRERRMREELEAYAQLDTTVAQGEGSRVDRVPATRALAMRVCRTVAEKSAFRRVMVLFREAEGSLRCLGSIGVDDLTAAAVERWAAHVVKEEREGGAKAHGLLGRAGARNVPISLGEWQEFDREISAWEMSGRKERRRWRRAVVLPIRAGEGAGLGGNKGRVVGAIVVCADGLQVPMEDDGGKLAVERMLSPLEALAARLGTTMENEMLSERLLRGEKLAGLGQLAGGVAHALNNPLTAVLGYAELMAETSGDSRVQEDARTILAQAMKMRETVERLVEFWRPATAADETVDVVALIQELAAACQERLAKREVKLEVVAQAGAGQPAVRGCRERLRQMMEQLLNNAAQAIAEARGKEQDGEGDEHSIRISVSHDEKTLYAIVSDTGTGFQEPGRAFDPFYTTKDPVEGAGMGLSICYGIVREHGGEIAAFNLHPRGAAVVVELPLGVAVTEPVPLLEGTYIAG
jgi:signal transduction histidine kinase